DSGLGDKSAEKRQHQQADEQPEAQARGRFAEVEAFEQQMKEGQDAADELQIERAMNYEPGDLAREVVIVIRAEQLFRITGENGRSSDEGEEESGAEPNR